MANTNGNGNGVEKLWYIGIKEISGKIGTCPNFFGTLVDKENLPAFKFYGRWVIRKEDLDTWSKAMAKKYRQAPQVKTRRTKQRRVNNFSVI